MQFHHQIQNILLDNKEINNQKDIKQLYLYYKNLFNWRQHLSEHDKQLFKHSF